MLHYRSICTQRHDNPWNASKKRFIKRLFNIIHAGNLFAEYICQLIFIRLDHIWFRSTRLQGRFQKRPLRIKENRLARLLTNAKYRLIKGRWQSFWKAARNRHELNIFDFFLKSTEETFCYRLRNLMAAFQNFCLLAIMDDRDAVARVVLRCYKIIADTIFLDTVTDEIAKFATKKAGRSRVLIKLAQHIRDVQALAARRFRYIRDSIGGIKGKIVKLIIHIHRWI